MTWTGGCCWVPAHHRLDTRRPMPAAVGRDQLNELSLRMRSTRGYPRGPPWPCPPAVGRALVATVVGAYGPSLGSYAQIVGAAAAAFAVLGTDEHGDDTATMGARVLQAGRGPLPDSEHNQRWTFGLLPGEPLTDQQVESGTILEGRVRFRLGRPDRGIGTPPRRAGDRHRLSEIPHHRRRQTRGACPVLPGFLDCRTVRDGVGPKPSCRPGDHLVPRFARHKPRSFKERTLGRPFCRYRLGARQWGSRPERPSSRSRGGAPLATRTGSANALPGPW